MNTVRLGFKAFDIHELLCHCVALHTGLYAAHGLQVSLVDTTFIPEDKLDPDLPQVACGAALASWLRGARLKVVFVATDRPMFWLYTRPGVASIDALRGQPIAGYPPIAPPAQLLNVLLGRAGLDSAVDTHIMAARDDAARIGLLGIGDVAAAVVSSAVPPAEMQRLGFHALAFFGDSIRVPTTGLAVSATFIARHGAAAQGLSAALRQALAGIHADSAMLTTVLERYFRIPTAALEDTAALIRRTFTLNGSTSMSIASNAVTAVARVLGIGSPPAATDLYTALDPG